MMSKWAPDQLMELTNLLSQSSHAISNSNHPVNDAAPAVGIVYQPLEHSALGGSIDRIAFAESSPAGPSDACELGLPSAQGTPLFTGGKNTSRASLMFARMPSSDLLTQVKESRLKTKSALASELSTSMPGSRMSSREAPLACQTSTLARQQAPAKSATGQREAASQIGISSAAAPSTGLRTVFDTSFGVRINTVRWGSGAPSEKP